MKKLLLPFLFIAPFTLNAQFTPLPNGGFENWDNVGSSTEEPQEWNSLMTGNLCGLCSTGAQQNCYREGGAANIHSGNYSVRIVTKVILGNPANGVVTIGQVTAPSTSASAGYNVTLTGNPAFNHPLGDTPDTLVFWAKYVPQDGTDSGRVSAYVHANYNLRDPQDGGSAPYVVARAVRNFRTGGNWVRFGVPFSYVGPASSPDYILVTFTSSKTPGVGTANTTLYIDDAQLIYNPTLSTGTITPLTYYVSAATGSTVTVPYTLTGTMVSNNVVTAQLSNSSGSFSSPVNIGTQSSTSTNAITATIPAGTATGSGYRIRVTTSNYPLTAADNGANIQIYLVSNSIAPSAIQTLEAGVNGTALNVTENVAPTSREWKYATASGGPYSSFSVVQTGASYTPNFASAGTYYLVCESTYPGGVTVRSNEVQINVVNNTVTPSASQSLLISSFGTTLNVNETPSGTSREWKYATVSGGPYSSFGPAETGATYQPFFATPGTYYVVCQSVISGVTCTSNEVVISVGSATLTTGAVSGSPFLFSPNAPDANVSVPFTVSQPMSGGNIFTAQISDANGSFASPLNIGTLIGTTSGTVNAIIPHTLPAGTGYRIRVVASNPSLFGADNGTNLIIDQFNNSIAPAGAQTIMYNTPGTALSVSESQTATRTWMYATVSGGPYLPVTPAATGTSYSPLFAMPGVYYVVCRSTNTYNDPVYSNEVMVTVDNGTTLTTSPVIPSVFYVSPNANVQFNVNFTSDIVFDPANVFTAELSDMTGSFAAPVVLGTLNGSVLGSIPCTLPNTTPGGNGYRIRVTSTSPSAIGSDNGTDLDVVQLVGTIAPADTQYILAGVNGATMNVTSSHPSSTFEWRYRTGPGAYLPFNPVQTATSYTPYFANNGTYQVTCFVVNQWSDTVQAQDVMIYVLTNPNGVDNEDGATISVYASQGSLWINMSEWGASANRMEILNINGQLLYTQPLQPYLLHRLPLTLPPAPYIYRIYAGTEIITGKFIHLPW